MTGSIYIHIPFCQCRCSYCDFYSTTLLNKRDEYVNAICQELQLRKSYLPTTKIGTIYLGGGTPSVLTIQQLQQLFACIEQFYDLSELTECTIECNPDDINDTYLAGLKTLPINRISMGVQSFNDAELQLMNRRHTAQQAIDAVHKIVRAGYTNCSIDLIYGLPNQTIEIWKNTLTTALSLPITHLSAYHLTYEKGTPMYQQQKHAVSEENSLLFFETLHQYTQQAGMEAYEISNFALPYCRSQHNSRYWKNIPYLGIGAGAHSYNGTERSWNIACLTAYMEGVESGKLVVETELLSDDDKYNELILTSLRTKEGIEQNKIPASYLPHFQRQCKKYIQGGLLEQNATHTYLTHQGIFVSDGIICDLMV